MSENNVTNTDFDQSEYESEPCGGLEPESARTSASKFQIYARNRQFDGLDYDAEGQWTGPYYFVQAADTQFGMMANFRLDRKQPDQHQQNRTLQTGNPEEDLATSSSANENHVKDDYNDDAVETPKIDWRQEVVLTRRAIEAINRLRPRPRFFVVCGDLIDAMPGEPYRLLQIRDYKSVLSSLHPDIRAVCVCGNHDIGNQPTPHDIDSYRRDFGDDYFEFWVGGCRYLVLNSQFYQDDSQCRQLRLEHDNWLDEKLKANQRRPFKHLIGFQHVAPFLNSRNEEPVDVFGDYRWCFNFADRKLRYEFLDKLKQAGMSKLFCGHYHRNAGGWDEKLEVVVTSAVGCQLGSDTHGFRIVKVTESAVTHEYCSIDKIPSQVKFDV